jgi:hypothetical protein
MQFMTRPAVRVPDAVLVEGSVEVVVWRDSSDVLLTVRRRCLQRGGRVRCVSSLRLGDLADAVSALRAALDLVFVVC